MSRYELVARGEIPEEDDSNYCVRVAQIRLKRKKDKRLLMAFICVVIFFFLAAGIAAGVVMGVSTAGNNGDDTKTNKELVSTAVIDSLPLSSVSQVTPQAVKVTTSSATRDDFTTTHSRSLKTLSPTNVPSVSPQATITNKTEVSRSSHTSSPTKKITFTDHTTTPSHTNSPTSTASTGVRSSASPQATMAKETVIKSEASSHTPTKKITVTDHTSQSTGTPTITIKTSSTNYVTTSAATVATLTTSTTSPTSASVSITGHYSMIKHTSASESTTSHYSTVTSSKANHIRTTTSQYTSLNIHITSLSASPSPTVIPVNTDNSQILNYIDTSYDPCENFYEYSCGHWHDNYPNASRSGTFHDLALDNYNKIGEYLSQYASFWDPDAILKAKYIYSACKDSAYISRNLISQLNSFMVNKAGGWDNGGFHPYDSWSIDNDLYKDHYLGSSAFFTFRVAPDDLDSSKQVVRVGTIAIARH